MSNPAHPTMMNQQKYLQLWDCKVLVSWLLGVCSWHPNILWVHEAIWSEDKLYCYCSHMIKGVLTTNSRKCLYCQKLMNAHRKQLTWDDLSTHSWHSVCVCVCVCGASPTLVAHGHPISPWLASFLYILARYLSDWSAVSTCTSLFSICQIEVHCYWCC